MTRPDFTDPTGVAAEDDEDADEAAPVDAVETDDELLELDPQAVSASAASAAATALIDLGRIV